jgi:hypothetical protein
MRKLDVYFTSPAPVCSLLGARASSPLLTQARRLRSQGTGSAFTKQTSSIVYIIVEIQIENTT